MTELAIFNQSQIDPNYIFKISTNIINCNIKNIGIIIASILKLVLLIQDLFILLEGELRNINDFTLYVSIITAIMSVILIILYIISRFRKAIILIITIVIICFLTSIDFSYNNIYLILTLTYIITIITIISCAVIMGIPYRMPLFSTTYGICYFFKILQCINIAVHISSYMNELLHSEIITIIFNVSFLIIISAIIGFINSIMISLITGKYVTNKIIFIPIIVLFICSNLILILYVYSNEALAFSSIQLTNIIFISESIDNMSLVATAYGQINMFICICYYLCRLFGYFNVKKEVAKKNTNRLKKTKFNKQY